MVEFNLQDFLRDMRREEQEAHASLLTHMQGGFAETAARTTVLSDALTRHTLTDLEVAMKLDARLSRLEEKARTVSWLAGALMVGTIGFLADMLVNHFRVIGP